MRTIRKGSTGPLVEQWQEVVGVEVDGLFGDDTLAATKTWQLAHGLDADGVVGRLTWTAAGFDAGAPASVATTLPGIDVSHWQGDIQWERVANAGVKFAVMKATQGVSYVDRTFAGNVKRARNAGLTVGAYHFAVPTNDPVAEAMHALDVAGDLARDTLGDCLPLVLDLEAKTSMPPATLADWAETWFCAVEDAAWGKRPILYTYSGYLRHVLGDEARLLVQWPLWIARYRNAASPGSVAPWERWLAWQHTAHGRVDGIEGRVDLDRFAGTEDDLRALCRGGG